ncbi:hypothetical protein [Paraburkholderia sp.]|nr:hypothetical protein [Paraburkholderia sp.]
MDVDLDLDLDLDLDWRLVADYCLMLAAEADRQSPAVVMETL